MLGDMHDSHDERGDERAAGDPEPAAVLLVNDSEVQLAAMEAALSPAGYRVVRAGSGRAALRCLLREDFAVIVLDVRMPDMDGFETAELIRARPRSRQTPIIFATAQAPYDAHRGYALGAVDYLIAPFDPQALAAKVRVFVELFEKAETIRALNAELREGLDRSERLNAALQRELEEHRRTEALLVAKAQELEEAVRDRASYDSTVAHDLRAPLRAILGYSALLTQAANQCLSGDSRAHLERIVAAAARMSELIDGLLSLSRVGRVELHRREVDVSEIAREILAVLATGHPDRWVETSVEDGMSAEADPVLLRLVMQNLLENAWKFTRERRPARIEVATEPGDPRAFRVSDNGAGFDMQYAGQLFRTFHRLHGAEFEGTGIGLATVRRIVERHGGQVWADAAPDRGATFRFTLPVVQQGHGAAEPMPTAANG